MGGYFYPCSVRNISDDFAEHKARGSVNPGVDYTASYGSPVYAPLSGKVTGTTSASGSGGRMVYIDLDDGNGVDLLHLSVIQCSVGQRVAAGQQVGLSGASGYGSDWYYGAHLHISIRDRHGSHTSGAGNFDFDAFMRGGAAGGGVEPIPETRVPEMLFFTISNPDGGGLNGTFWGVAPRFLTVYASKDAAAADAARYQTDIQTPLTQSALTDYAATQLGIPQDQFVRLGTSSGAITTWSPEASSGGTGASVDQIDAKLAPRFDAIPDAVVDEFASRLGGTRSVGFIRDVALIVIGVAIILLSLMTGDPTRLIGVGIGVGVGVLGLVALISHLRHHPADSL